MRRVDEAGDANVILIPTEGPQQFWHREDAMPLDQARSMLNIGHGTLQIVHVYWNGEEKAQMLINENGKLLRLPLNPRATHLFHVALVKDDCLSNADFIVGPALILVGKARWT